MNSLIVLILAAGKGTRLKSSLPKVLHALSGKPLIEYVLAAAQSLAPRKIGVVVGYEAERVKVAAWGASSRICSPRPPTRYRTRCADGPAFLGR